MLLPLYNIAQNRNYTLPVNKYKQNYSQIPALKTCTYDQVQFTGMSLASSYSSVFDYMAAEILSKNKRINGSQLSATKIRAAIEELFNQEKAFGDYKKTLVEKIKWKSYIPDDVRTYSIDKINKAREVRLKEWRDFLFSPTDVSRNGEIRDRKLVSKVKNDKSLRIVIWESILSEIKDNNRHIPVPFNDSALLETIQRFERIDAKDRATSCVKPSFLEIYTHKLRDNLLMDMGISNNSDVWVKIPSLKHEPHNKSENIAKLETLSCRNWCTRSSVDKAEDALADGDFYIYLRRNNMNLWEPLVGMTSCKGKIDQIQGVENNNIVPLNLLEEIKSFIQRSNLKCASGVFDEGPKAHQAILISDKLSEVNQLTKKTFMKAIRENDDVAIFDFLEVPVVECEGGGLKIPNYKPTYTMKTGGGITIPYSMFGINEDQLLRNVRIIDGNLILHNNKTKLFSSGITEFPPMLERVNGRVVCSESQYKMFKDDIDRVIGNDKSKLVVRTFEK